MAVKIKLKRLGKKRNPQYRIIVADSRTRRDGRAIEEIGLYHPKEEPSLIKVDSERAQYWLGVGAQPTDAVMALLKVTGDWQKFKGIEGAEGTLRTAEEKPDKKAIFDQIAKSVDEEKAKFEQQQADKAKAEAEAAEKAKAEAEAAEGAAQSEQSPQAESAESSEATAQEADGEAAEAKADTD